MESKASGFTYLGYSVYLLIWLIIEYFKIFRYIEEQDPISHTILLLDIILGGVKISASILSLVILCGARSEAMIIATTIYMLISRIIDAIPLGIYAYFGLLCNDPMARLFFVPKAVDTFCFWFVTGVGGLIKPFYLCYYPKPLREKKLEDGEEIELEELAED